MISKPLQSGKPGQAPSKPGADIQFRVTDGDNETAVSQIGDGKQQRLSLAVHAANLGIMQGHGPESQAEILAYDEPDTHLDYQSQRQLYDIIVSQSELLGVQVVVATHSANFIDKVPLSSIIHLRQEQDGHTVYDILGAPSDVEEEALLHRLAAGIGPRNSSLFGEMRFFVVEGQTEECALPLFYRQKFGRSLAADGVAVINAQGSTALRSIVAALRRWRKEVVFLVDEDARSEPNRVISEQWLRECGFREKIDVFFVGSKELEDAFDDITWCRVLNSHFEPKDGNSWMANDIAQIRQHPKFSSALLELIKARLGWAPGKPQVGQALAATIREDEIPKAVVRALEELHSRAAY